MRNAVAVAVAPSPMSQHHPPRPATPCPALPRPASSSPDSETRLFLWEQACRAVPSRAVPCRAAPRTALPTTIDLIRVRRALTDTVYRRS